MISPFHLMSIHTKLIPQHQILSLNYRPRSEHPGPKANVQRNQFNHTLIRDPKAMFYEAEKITDGVAT